MKSFQEFLFESKSNLNQNFFKWFGKSQIKKSNKPLICYHGSKQKDIQEFDANKIGTNTGNYGHYGYGIYFSTDIREAKGYGTNIYECYLKIEKPFTGEKNQMLELKKNGAYMDDLIKKSIDIDSLKSKTKNMKHIHNFILTIEKNSKDTISTSKAWEEILELSKKEPSIDLDIIQEISDIMEYTSINKYANGVPDWALDSLDKLGIKPSFVEDFEYEQSLHWVTNLGENSKEVTDIMIKLGYDGVWYGSEIVVFNGNQIKSVNNDGNWSPNTNNIND